MIRVEGLACERVRRAEGGTPDRRRLAERFPDPLLLCASRLGLDPAQCVYVGDDLRDVQAGRAAGMRTVAVRWGYLGEGEAIDAWQADHVISHPSELLALLGLAD